MNSTKAFLIAVCSLFANIIYSQNNFQKETFIYSIKVQDTLRFDKYDIDTQEKKPCVIFMFGGGFFTGQRDNELFNNYFKSLNDNGFVVISIDYRLGFKGFKPDENLGLKDFLRVFENTVYMAVEDLYDATNYILQNADNWNIDKSKIVISGSSAGAISVLQGEYELCNRTEVSNKLPADFRYAGVVAFAGAIYSNKGNLKWNNTPAPIQLFHGDSDKNVPFDKLKITKWGFFGSKYIINQFDKNKYPYYFHIEQNTAHKVAVTPMHDNLDEINKFLNEYVLQKNKLITNVNILPLNAPVVKNKKFKIKDYVKSNF